MFVHLNMKTDTNKKSAFKSISKSCIFSICYIEILHVISLHFIEHRDESSYMMWRENYNVNVKNFLNIMNSKNTRLEKG